MLEQVSYKIDILTKEVENLQKFASKLQQSTPSGIDTINNNQIKFQNTMENMIEALQNRNFDKFEGKCNELKIKAEAITEVESELEDNGNNCDDIKGDYCNDWQYVQGQLQNCLNKDFLYFWITLEATKSYEHFVTLRTLKQICVDDKVFKSTKERMCRWNKYVKFMIQEFQFDLGDKPKFIGKQSDKEKSILDQWREEAKEKSVTYF